MASFTWPRDMPEVSADSTPPRPKKPKAAVIEPVIPAATRPAPNALSCASSSDAPESLSILYTDVYVPPPDRVAAGTNVEPAIDKLRATELL